jgi:hypothetical protein
MMTCEEYISKRLDDQINWYDQKSIKNQKMYKTLRNIEIVCSTLLTFCSGLMSKFSFSSWVVGILGIIISITAGLLSLNKYHENWIEYRSVCETLRHEKFMFLTNTGVYSRENPFPLLVERVESIISHENVNWAQLNNSVQGNSNHPNVNWTQQNNSGKGDNYNE